MTSPTPRPTRARTDGHAARRAGARAAVVDAAVRLVARQGFWATSVDAIAAEAGVAKGSVYYNFASKSEILEAALAEGDPAWVQRAMTRLLAEVREQGTPLDDDPLIDSDVIMPEADTPPEQLRDWVGDTDGAGGLLP